MSILKPPDLTGLTDFKIPNWAGKPPAGLHLDVLKDGKMIQKLMIDEKNCYLFGRNRQYCDFPIDHQSCSRVHGALVWHKDLHRPFLIDCNSAHGTFVGSIRLESGKPQQIPIDSKIHFGASTRIYVIRERLSSTINGLSAGDNSDFNSTLPEDETELDNLTEFNTAQNRRNTSVMDATNSNSATVGVKATRKHGLYIHFSDQEEVINPEDVDPSIGRFRNLVQETFIPKKKARMVSASGDALALSNIIPKSAITPIKEEMHVLSSPTNAATPNTTNTNASVSHINPAFSAASKLGISIPNLAAEPSSSSSLYSDVPSIMLTSHSSTADSSHSVNSEDGPRKKKYAKEAWPGKKPGHIG